MNGARGPRTVLVTGASRGIGLAVARRYAAAGAAVGLVAGDPGRLADAAGQIDGRLCTVAADLCEPAECRRAVAEVRTALGPIDRLVSCAGILGRDFVEDITDEDFERHFRLHAGAALCLTRELLPDMRARGRGSLVYVSSELGLIGAPSYGSYCASKWALLGFVECLQHELVGSGVSACAVCPGDVRTDQLASESAWGPTGGVSYEAAMSPDDVARAVVRAAAGRRRLVIIDRPKERALFTLMAGPRRMRFGPVHDAFKALLAERRSPR